MKTCMIIDVKKKINALKQSHGKLITNFYYNSLDDMQKAECLENEKALVFLVQEPFRKRVYFAAADPDACSALLSQLPENSVLEYICQDNLNPLEPVFINGGMERYTSYIRVTMTYSENPYEAPEAGRRKLLQDMYDPEFGEYAGEEHAAQLYQITREVFDEFCDDIFTFEKWKKIIADKECLLYCEEGEIVAYYVYRLEGKKLYSNLSVNKGAANYLYNLERRVFEEMWEKGIQTFYAWFNESNVKALQRENEMARKCVKSRHEIYNFIYIKK